jgi:hypothetical protein
MRCIVVLVAIALGLSLSAAVFAGWSDSFEGYQSGVVLPDPWVNSNIHVLGGYGTTQGAARYGYGEWDKFSEYRPTVDQGTVLTARLYNAMPGPYGTLDYGVAQVGLSSGPIAGDGQLANWGNPVNYLSVMALHATERSTNTLYFDVTDTDGTNFHRTTVGGLAWDQWYDVKIVISGASSAGYYKPTGAANWISMGSYDQPAGFVGYSYAGICSSRLGTIDDINWGLGGAISGTVTLQNYSSANAPMAVRVQLIQNNVVVRNENVMLGTNGSYTIENVPEGTYSVVFKAAQFLAQTVPVVAVTGSGTATCSVTLPNGDQDGDGEVTSTDVSLVLVNTGQTGN